MALVARHVTLTTRCLLQLLLWAKRGGPRRALSLCWHVRDQNAILKLRDMQRPAWGDAVHAALHRRRGPAGEQLCRHDVAASSWLVGLVVAALSRPDTYVTALVRERVRSAVWVELLRVAVRDLDLRELECGDLALDNFICKHGVLSPY